MVSYLNWTILDGFLPELDNIGMVELPEVPDISLSLLFNFLDRNCLPLVPGIEKKICHALESLYTGTGTKLNTSTALLQSYM